MIGKNPKNRIKKKITKINYTGNYEAFFEYLSRGIFAMPYCRTCKKNTWPPTDYCPTCLDKMELNDLKEETGKLIEILSSFVGKKTIDTEGVENFDLIGLVDFGGVKLLGLINKESYNHFIYLNKNKLHNSVKSSDYSSVDIKLKKCGICKNKIFYEFELISK